MNDTRPISDHRIPPRSGAAFELKKGDRLAVIDPEGQQVADLLAFNAHDLGEVISNGRTFDYADTIYLTTGATLFSNRSSPMLKIVEDDVGRHDFLLTPCSRDTFERLYDDIDDDRPGCFGNLAAVLKPYGIAPDAIPCAFNCFMNVPVDGETGTFTVEPPLSKAGDRVVFEAQMDLVIGLTACSAPKSNGGSTKPIEFQILS